MVKPLEILSTDLDKVIKSRFKHLIADPETRNQLLPWDDTEITLDQMVQKAKEFENFCGSEAAKLRKPLRMTDTSFEISQLKKQNQGAPETDCNFAIWKKKVILITTKANHLELWQERTFGYELQTRKNCG